MGPSKWIAAVLTGYLTGLALGFPTTASQFMKRASINDVCKICMKPHGLDVLIHAAQAATGCASENGGTTGGAGGTSTTVSSYTAFTKAVSSDDAKIVVVSGTISETADQARVGSNTSVIGKDSNAILEGFGM